MKTINIDISDLYRAKGRSGIQRVIRELVPRLMYEKEGDFTVRVLNFNAQKHCYEVFVERDSLDFLDEKIVTIQPVKTMDFSEFSSNDIFFDIDSAWNIPLKRPYLYKTLKSHGVYIITLLHDIVPLKLPQFAHENTLRNFALFISAVYTHSDMVVCNSRTTERDFLEYKDKFQISRYIPTVVSKLGSDFTVRQKPGKAELKTVEKFIDKKFILFVGTIEPRKRHDLAIAAFEEIAETHQDVHLVFAGKKGWHSDATMAQLENSQLYGERLHWVDTPPDSVLAYLYEKCHMALYLSNYEGFGLPVAEPLNYGKVTVASSNSSLYEAGKDFADYVYFNTKTEVVETISRYLSDTRLYEAKRQAIKSYSPYKWEDIYRTIFNVIDGLSYVEGLKSRPIPKALQWVFITVEPNILARTIALIDKRAPFVKEYLVITPKRYAKIVQDIPTKHTITVIPDETVLGGRLGEFRRADHVLKNWMLRSSLADMPEVDEEFIMLDDDNQPLVAVDINYYINPDRTYNAYYFYELPNWPYCNTDYDYGQQSMKKVLDNVGYELLTYSSHKPQVINKTLFKGVTDTFKNTALSGHTVDEWSAYFNYVATKYPTLMRKKLFETMNWPARPTDWQHQYSPPKYTFENYYEKLYTDEKEVFFGLSDENDAVAKTKRKNTQVAPYERAKALYAQSKEYISAADIAHGMMKFTYDDTSIYLAGLPYVITTGRNATVRIDLNFKVVTKRYFTDNVSLCYQVGGSSNQVSLRAAGAATIGFSESLASLPVSSQNPGIYNGEFFLIVNGLRVDAAPQRYTAKLVVCADNEQVPGVYKRL